ncbi:IS5/IS1182 family transposase [Natrialba aegyptia]|uniref:ISH9-type transposase n=1 Tax=Natrialba aegyptia DSM 13077 TaxID=1227491 RepID=M0ASF1_9EURY|nr:IS5/IS1182 family transposase [Natrialba aegyptia]ELZ01252.1 ISH9-type transposase [Natrialba aegyptia DSM 13077]
MQALPKSRLLRFVEQAIHLARRAVARYSSKFSKRRYTLLQYIVLLCLKVRKNTTRKHDSQIAPSLIKRNTDEVVNLLKDKGYDDQKSRTLAREEDVRPLIKHREFSSLHKAWNARLDDDLYGQRSQNETVNSCLKPKYGSFVRSRHWWKQFEKSLTHNLDRSL